MSEGDRIDLRGLTAWAHHGVLEREREDGQRFVLDLTVWLDLSVAAASDALGDTVHYGLLAQAVMDVLAGEPRQLIETVAGEIASTTLAFDSRIERVRVVLHKPDAPIPLPFDEVAVTIDRRRA